MDLFWLPLGAGGHVVRWNGRAYEAAAALLARRPRQDLYHSALEVHLPLATWVVEMTPVWLATDGSSGRGVVAEGAVGARWAGRSRLFRYEVRCWRGGSIGDVGEAVGGAVRLTDDAGVARRLLDGLPAVPAPVWGRDELRTGEMWNSNSVTSWALAGAGLDPASLAPPGGGRAPGWAAVIAVAGR